MLILKNVKLQMFLRNSVFSKFILQFQNKMFRKIYKKVYFCIFVHIKNLNLVEFYVLYVYIIYRIGAAATHP